MGSLLIILHFISVFYRLYNYIQPASRLVSGCDYSVFKVCKSWQLNINIDFGYLEFSIFSSAVYTKVPDIGAKFWKACVEHRIWQLKFNNGTENLFKHQLRWITINIRNSYDNGIKIKEQLSTLAKNVCWCYVFQ